MRSSSRPFGYPPLWHRLSGASREVTARGERSSWTLRSQLALLLEVSTQTPPRTMGVSRVASHRPAHARMAFVARPLEKMSGCAHRLRYEALRPAGAVRRRSLTTRLLPCRYDRPLVALCRLGAASPACLSLFDDTQVGPTPSSNPRKSRQARPLIPRGAVPALSCARDCRHALAGCGHPWSARVRREVWFLRHFDAPEVKCTG
jgi:hypothetical protein